ncbi:MAG: hypothetical protein K6F43_03305 [Prevotella sp.]|nr:hypothetical protein [Prevotella sp.]
MNDAENTTFLSTYQLQERTVQLFDRTLQKNGSWNTLCLPFSLTAEQIAASPLPAAIINPEFVNVTISADEPSSVTIGDVKFVGTFSPIFLAYDGTKLFVSSNNQLHYPSKASYYINSCRAYFDVNWSISSGARLEIILDDETTGIQEVKEVKCGHDDSWYTLDGRKLSTLKKGLYIVNGKKVAVK